MADSALGRQLRWKALDRVAELDLDSALVLYRAARSADPEYLTAHDEYIVLMTERGQLDDLAAEYAPVHPSGSATMACLHVVAAFPASDAQFQRPVLEALEARERGSACSALYLLSFLGRDRDADARRVELDRYWRRAVAGAPDHSLVWASYAGVLVALGDGERALAVLDEGLRRCAHAVCQLRLLLHRAALQAASGDSAGARATLRAVGAAVERDGRPGLRFLWLGSTASLGRVLGNWTPAERVASEQFRLLLAHGAWGPEYHTRISVGGGLVDVGDPTAALPHFHRAVRIADSAGSPWLQLRAYTWRGRAYAKLGRLREAERDLVHALAAGRRTRSRYYVAEAYHNLAHVYESMGRLDSASRAADRFIALTRPMRTDPLRVMSLHDAGMIRWKANWHAAAREAFREMVRAVDEIESEFYWAGEYFERGGDLPNALRYYRLGAQRYREPQSLRGLARVHEKLANWDSAAAAARAHDRAVAAWTPLELPVLPGVLSRQGRMAEAVSLSEAWAARQLATGNAQGAAVANLQLGELLLEWGRAGPAREAATRAESLALRLNLTDELIDARRLRGLALTRLGDTESGLRVLRAAAMLASARPTVDGVLATQVALADALAAAGRHDEALRAYDTAARTVERVTERLEEDLDRAGYRDRHLLPFDGALSVLLGQAPSAARLEQIARWSQRRKGAALALAALAGSGGPRLTLGELSRRLRAGEVLLDYLVIDGSVAVVVVEPDAARLVRLPASTDSVARLVEQLRRPLTTSYVGRVDLARAPFDLRVAHALYRILLEPLGGTLLRSHRLVVVPDGALHAVPFTALVTALPEPARDRRPGYVSAQYVIDGHEVAYLPSAQFLRTGPGGSSPAHPRGRLLAVERNAPGGAREIGAIRAVWPEGRVTVLAGAAATERAVRRARDYAILHFATHAEADNADPLASHLRLGADAEDDGFYHLAEIAGERRSARLVVLSACQTLSGRSYEGEGFMGLARAFLVSGAEGVVATQWPVGATSADLMKVFYRRLAAGDSPAVALRTAQLELRRDPRTAHPFFWAGFVLVEGRGRQ